VLSAGLGGAGAYTRGESPRGVLFRVATGTTGTTAGQRHIGTGTSTGTRPEPDRNHTGTSTGTSTPAPPLPYSGTSACAPPGRCVSRCRPFRIARGDCAGPGRGSAERL